MGLPDAITALVKKAPGAIGAAAPAPKAFKPTGTMIGAGVGAVGGGIGGAATAPTDPQTGKRKGVLGRTLGGAVMGAGLGAGVGKGVSMHRAGNLNMNTLRDGLDKMKARAGQAVDDIKARANRSPSPESTPAPDAPNAPDLPQADFELSPEQLAANPYASQFEKMTPQEAKKFYRQKARELHPDKFTEGTPEAAEAAEKFVQYKNAYKHFHDKTGSADDLIFHFFFDEMHKLAANRRSGPLRIPGIANGRTPRGLADPTPAQAGNLAKFQNAGPGKAMVTGSSPSGSNPGSLISSGTTTQVGMPSPKPVM